MKISRGDIGEYKRRLENFYKRRTTFNVRWKREFTKDYIAPGVFKDEFLKVFTRGELKGLVALKLVEESTITDMQTRATVIYIGYEMPQVSRFKKICHWIQNEPQAAIGFIGVLVCLILLSIMWPRQSHAEAKARSIVLKNEPSIPPSTDRGYFDDTTGPVVIRCYWIYHKGLVALSCVKK